MCIRDSRCRQFSSRSSYAHWKTDFIFQFCLSLRVGFFCLSCTDYFHICIDYLIILHSIVTIMQGRSMKYDHETHLFPRQSLRHKTGADCCCILNVVKDSDLFFQVFRRDFFEGFPKFMKSSVREKLYRKELTLSLIHI